MATNLILRVTEDGLRLPRQLFPQLGEVEVIKRDEYILIKPKPPVAPADDLRARVQAGLRESGLLITPDWPSPPVVSPAKRAALARKLSHRPPLSEIVIEDRADRA